MTLHAGITEATALIGAFTGIAALVLSITNYLRDNPRVRVTLLWDMSVTDNPRYDRNKLWGIVSVANVGRPSRLRQNCEPKAAEGLQELPLHPQ